MKFDACQVHTRQQALGFSAPVNDSGTPSCSCKPHRSKGFGKIQPSSKMEPHTITLDPYSNRIDLHSLVILPFVDWYPQSYSEISSG